MLQLQLRLLRRGRGAVASARAAAHCPRALCRLAQSRQPPAQKLPGARGRRHAAPAQAPAAPWPTAPPPVVVASPRPPPAVAQPVRRACCCWPSPPQSSAPFPPLLRPHPPPSPPLLLCLLLPRRRRWRLHHRPSLRLLHLPPLLPPLPVPPLPSPRASPVRPPLSPVRPRPRTESRHPQAQPQPPAPSALACGHPLGAAPPFRTHLRRLLALAASARGSRPPRALGPGPGSSSRRGRQPCS